MTLLQTLRRRSKLYGAAPNFTASLLTLRSPSKHYDGAPNVTAPFLTLRCLTKLYGAAPNVMTRLQTLRRPSKLYDAAPNFTEPLQTLRRRSKLYDAPPNITMPLQTLRSGSKHYGGAPNFTTRFLPFQTLGFAHSILAHLTVGSDSNRFRDTKNAPKGQRHVTWGWRCLPAPGQRQPKNPKAPKGRRQIGARLLQHSTVQALASR